jgi:hypothetical protein
MFAPDLQETVVIFFMVESLPSSFYLLGNIQSGKSEKELESLAGALMPEENSPPQPLLI